MSEIMDYKTFTAMNEEIEKNGNLLYKFITDNDEVYAKFAAPIISNIKRKSEKGFYNKDQAIKALGEIVDRGARDFIKTLLVKPTEEMFSKKVKKSIASKLETFYMTM